MTTPETNEAIPVAIQDEPVIDVPVDEQPAAEQQPAYRFYGAYAWATRGVKKQGFGHILIRSPVPDMNEDVLRQILVRIKESNLAYDEVTIINWKDIE
jgi:hypothetical protein